MKYLVVANEYFTKWIEAEPVAQITAHKIEGFVWKNIVCRFGVPKRLVSDNGTQFASHLLKKLCEGVGIQQVFCIRRAPSDKWPGGVSQSGVAERFEEKARESQGRLG